jgi:hypothetical protein
VENCQICGREGAESYGRAKAGGKMQEIWKCPNKMRFQCIELALYKQKLESVEKREKERDEWKRTGKLRPP